MQFTDVMSQLKSLKEDFYKLVGEVEWLKMEVSRKARKVNFVVDML